VIELRTLGTVDLRDLSDGRQISSILAGSSRVALLTYLAVSTPRGSHRRDKLIAVFWPETTEERARNALSQAVFVLRRGLGNAVVVTSGDDEVGLDSEKMRCDAAAFEQLLDEGRKDEALELYRGDLLEGFYVPEYPAFERWLEGERRRLRKRARDAALSLADDEEASENTVEAVHWLRRAAIWAPYDEALLQRLVTLLHAAGDRSGAIREYDGFEKRLAEELKLEPSPETRALSEAIRSEASAPDVERRSALSTLSVTDLAPATEPARRRGRGRWLAAASAAAVLLLAGAAATDWFTAGPEAPDAAAAELEPRRVLVLPLRNETGGADLDPIGRVAADWLTQGLLRTGRLQVVSGTETLGFAESGEGAGQPSADLALGLAREVGAAYAITGSYMQRNGELLFQVQIHRTVGGDVAVGVEVTGGDLADPMAAIEQLRQRTTGALAALLDPRSESWAHAASQPPTFEAYRLYAEGMDHFMRYEGKEALSRFYEAAALDSTFIVPLIWALFAELNGWGEPGRADSLIRVLEPRRETMAPLDRAMLDHHAAGMRGDKEAAYELMRKVVEIAPNSEWQAWLAVMARSINRPREALELLSRVDPERGWIKDWWRYWGWLAGARHDVGDHEGELRDISRGRRVWSQHHTPKEVVFDQIELYALAALGRTEELELTLDRFLDGWLNVDSETSPAYPVFFAETIIVELRVHGHEEATDAVLTRVLSYFDALSREEQDNLNARQWLAGLLFAAERWGEARSLYEKLLPDLSGPGALEVSSRGAGLQKQRAHGRLGVMAARRGDREEAMRYYRWLEENDRSFDERAADDVDKRFRGVGPLWQAEIMAHLGERKRAVALLREGFALGYGHAYWLRLRGRYRPLHGYPPFEELLRPKG